MSDRAHIDISDSALQESYSEQSALDDLLVKLATGGFGFSVSLGAFADDPETVWLTWSWFVLLAAVLVVVVSKFLSVAGLRAYFVSERHEDAAERERARCATEGLDRWITRCNVAGGVGVGLGALLLAAHVAS
jgi:hypothetical protein